MEKPVASRQSSVVGKSVDDPLPAADLLDQVIDIAHYRNEAPQVCEELLDAAARNYFVRFDHDG